MAAGAGCSERRQGEPIAPSEGECPQEYFQNEQDKKSEYHEAPSPPRMEPSHNAKQNKCPQQQGNQPGHLPSALLGVWRAPSIPSTA